MFSSRQSMALFLCIVLMQGICALNAIEPDQQCLDDISLLQVSKRTRLQGGWDCAHYRNGMTQGLCKMSPIINGVEYGMHYGDGTCGGCWCCKREVPKPSIVSAGNWQCAHYTDGMNTHICELNPIIGNNEYLFTKGNGTCGGCWCCKRQLETTTRTTTLGPDALSVGSPMDYEDLAFNPDRWKIGGYDFTMYPWEGKGIVFLTPSDKYDPNVMGVLVMNLDLGWATYADFINRAPNNSTSFHGKVTMAGMPADDGLTCGMACGRLGQMGIEDNAWVSTHYPRLKNDPMSVPHLYFYEMGRNYYVFGDRWKFATTGFAVFMRYVCVSKVGTRETDNEVILRTSIESAIGLYEDQRKYSFVDTFANIHVEEKQSRLEGSSADQPVMVASLMLKLWKQFGDNWLRGFYSNIDQAPEVDMSTEEGLQSQLFNWYLAASLAAKTDLSDLFVDKWGLQLTAQQDSVLPNVSWSSGDMASVARAALPPATWECAHYTAEITHAKCVQGFSLNGYDYKMTYGDGTCGGCWCCKIRI